MSSTWRIGVLFSMSGVTAAAETAQANATVLAVEEINAAGGVLGRPLRSVFYDPECSAEKYREFTIRLLKDDNVSVVFGCYMSSARKAVLPEIESRRGLLFYPTFYEGFEYSPRCFYSGSSANQNALQLARFMMNNFGSRFLLVGSNYVFPYEYNRVVNDLVTSASGQVVDEIYVPVEAVPQDFDRVVKQIRKHKPDVIVSTVVGTGAAQLYQAYSDAGFDPATMPIASLTTTEAELSQMSPRIASGHLTSASFFETLETPAARRFVSAFKARFGPDAPVTASAEAVYVQVHLYAKALALAGRDDPEAIAQKMAGLEFEAPQGRVRVDPDNHHTELWSRIGKVNDAGKFDILWQSEGRIRPDPYFVSASLEDWKSAPRRMKRKAALRM